MKNEYHYFILYDNQRKTPLIFPYSLYMKKIKEVNKYRDPDSSTIIKDNNMNDMNRNNNNNNTENNNSYLNTHLNNNTNKIWSYDYFNNKNYFNRNHKNSFFSS